MEVHNRAPQTASSGSSSQASDQQSGATSPFVLRHGRRYLKNLSYPLPHDLPELQRQNLHTQLAVSAFGTPLCCPGVVQRLPKKVLEIGCGTGFWSSLCHDLFASLGRADVEFVGLDVVPVTPNMRKHGMNWRFVQHDLRNGPLPFEDAEFDLVMLKDMSIVVPVGLPSERLLDEAMRLLRPGGVLEWWECDYQIRSILPHPRPSTMHSKTPRDLEQAATTGTFVITPATPFASRVPNKYLREYNAWIYSLFDKNHLSATPCSKMAPAFLQEPDSLTDVSYRRIAIPLGSSGPSQPDGLDESSIAVGSSEDSVVRVLDTEPLNGDQLAMRHMALQILSQLVESLEQPLKEVSSKSTEEWSRWWTWMMADLHENGGASHGECWELGAYWAHKV